MVRKRERQCPKVTIIGNTSWGNTLGALLGDKGATVELWTRSEVEAEELNQGRRSYSSTSHIGEALSGADLAIWAVPSQKLRENVARARDHLTSSMILVSAAKGLEVDSGKRMSQVLAEEVAPSLRGQICVLSGPNLAGEIAGGFPAASVIAAQDMAWAGKARKLMESPKFVVSTSDDVVGVELGGALKNIIALGAGMIDGLGLGDNAKGAFIAWGWTEVVSLGVALGARAGTFYGLAGLGDLITTCASTLSRNHYVGYELAKGRSLSEISASMTHVAEGVATTAAVHRLAKDQGLKLPIINLIHGILYEGLPPSRVLSKFEGLVAGHRCSLD
ncbi:MAG: NAD(P)-dependent glycerol-3-phosphate dehydrogenase [Dehalococcoidia bacterium]|nr:NAD(P)-dependent glycerol-3-phosphate dehydrogenase [Dehalococcoidia bacterium]MDH4299213.1 NAD(P)-dependent glycerol-3-phosphate dehydrogenase [Dehalococcoidia bacterium]MDH4367438.1 NAD(P)-dependent glycerol-3-phosphate dehydrogenase [Dehalococcoidia bacterium]